MTDRIRKIGIKEMAQEAALRAVYGLLRDIEGEVSLIANFVAQNPEVWNKTAKYFRNFGENLYMAFVLLELLLGEFTVYEEDLEFYDEEFDEVFEEDEYENWGS
jgi:hypothetical protein